MTAEFTGQFGTSLKNLGENGEVPETRLSDPYAAKDFVDRVIAADSKRSPLRALAQGLIDGNPPYRQADQIKAGKGNQCNVNWRLGEAFLGQARDALYDTFSEAPTLSEVRHNSDDERKREDWSGIITEEFEKLQKKDRSFDYHMQMSENFTMTHGIGPVIWEDKYSLCVKYRPTSDVLVDDDVPSDVEQWERCAILMEYSASEMYEFIRNGEAARSAGWNVVAARQAIMSAHPASRDRAQTGRNWEWHQQQLRENNFGYSYSAEKVRVAMVLFREFSGKITKLIIPRDETQYTSTGGRKRFEFLFQSVNYCDDWHQVIAPMYLDHGTGGHHSVKGLGVKFYSNLEYQNRLLCAIADKSMQPKVMLRPMNAEAANKSSIMQMGDYLVAPPGYEVSQVGFSGMLEDSLVANRHFENLLSANLGQYRSGQMKEQGNPPTATQMRFEAGQQARIGKTGLARYYEQMDFVYSERYRRAAQLNIPAGTKMSKEMKYFQDCCERRGIPKGELQNFESVKATRIIGQGSAMLRHETLAGMIPLLGMLPESGRINVLRDYIASDAGQVMVNRYYPTYEIRKLPSDHQALAMLQVAGMKEGVPPVVTDSQDHVLYATTFLNAAFQSVKTLQQGGDPAEVASFIELAGPAVGAHLQQVENDTSKKAVVDQMRDQLKQLSQIHDKLIGQIQKMQQQRQQQMAQQAQVMSEQQLAQAALQGDEQRKNFKVQKDDMRKDFKANQDIARKSVITAQDLKLKDAKTASEIQINRLKAASVSDSE